MLNPRQKEAAEYFDTPLLVVAGAGTGKTRTIIHKILHAIDSGFASANQILVTTFTNKAANELKNRLYEAISSDVHLMTIGTFHSISLDLLQQHGHHLGFEGSLGVFPYEDQVQLVRTILIKHNIRDIKPANFLEKIQKHKESLNPKPFFYQEILKEYEEEMRMSRVLDFADLLLKSIELFEATELSNYRLICIDEYQDINDLQDSWVKLLFREGHLCCVGDPDQAIYGFRGANAAHILNFQKSFPTSKIIKLEENYRSSRSILDAANKLIAHNKHRIPKMIYTTSTVEELPVELRIFHTAQLEAQWIAKSCKECIEQSSVAILVRSRSQIPIIEEALLGCGLAYSVSGSIELLDRREIKDMIAYLRFVHNPNDSISLQRILQAPRRGLGLSMLDKIRAKAREHQGNLLHGSSLLLEDLTGSIKEKMKIFVKFLQEVFEAQNHGLMTLANLIYIKSGYLETIEEERRENVTKWIRSLAEFSNLQEYLEKVLWQSASDPDLANVHIMTIHLAKGLEFDQVFLPGWEDGSLPHQLSRSTYEIEEERRLGYVAVTRGKKRVNISYSSTRIVGNMLKNTTPSRFIREMHLCHTPIKATTGQAGSSVVHPRFGNGIIEDVGPKFMRVRFVDMVRMVPVFPWGSR